MSVPVEEEKPPGFNFDAIAWSGITACLQVEHASSEINVFVGCQTAAVLITQI